MSGSHALPRPALPPRCGHVLGAEIVQQGSGWRPVVDPSREETLCEAPVAGEALVARAAGTAARAWQDDWRDRPGGERRDLLLALATLVREHGDELSVLAAVEAGVPVSAGRHDAAPLAAAHLRHAAGWADKLSVLAPPARAASLGVVAVLAPAHDPLPAAVGRLAPALAAGNTVVLKPAPTAPLSAARLAALALQAGFPPGVLQVVLGDDDTGALLAGRPEIAVVSAGGRAATLAALRAALAGSGRRLVAGAGGRGVHVVFEDAAPDQAADGLLAAFRTPCGTAAQLASLLLVQESVLDGVTARLRERMEDVQAGDALDPATELGPLPTAAARDRLRAWVDGARRQGAAVHEAGRPPPRRGFFLRPTLVAGLDPSQPLAAPPVPGPALALVSFRTPDEALRLLRGLPDLACASVFTDKGSRLFAAAAGLPAPLVLGNASGAADPAQRAGVGRAPRDPGGGGPAAYLDLSR